MRIATVHATDGGMTREWRCRDSRCTGIEQAEPVSAPRRLPPGVAARGDLARASDAYLGAPLGELMEAPVTPQGAGGGGSRQRRRPKAGEVQANRERMRERRGATQEPLLGGRDKEIHVEKKARNFQGRVTKQDAEFLDFLQSQIPGASQTTLVQLSVVAIRDRVARSVRACGCGMPLVAEDLRCPRCGAEA